VANYYEGPGQVEAVFSTPAAACEYARRRSAEKYRNSGQVTCWELDNPAHRIWHSSYQDGEQQHVNTRLRWPEN
jgi:hypothetical protein